MSRKIKANKENITLIKFKSLKDILEIIKTHQWKKEYGEFLMPADIFLNCGDVFTFETFEEVSDSSSKMGVALEGLDYVIPVEWLEFPAGFSQRVDLVPNVWIDISAEELSIGDVTLSREQEAKWLQVLKEREAKFSKKVTGKNNKNNKSNKKTKE